MGTDQEGPPAVIGSGELLDGKYRLEVLLGHGGMGAVYRAIHLGTTRTVAVKVIQPRLSRSSLFVARFEQEAEAAGRLRHPNVVDVTDFGFADTREGPVAYLVMEYLDGCTLADVLHEERHLPLGWVVDILDQVCSALDEAHAHGIVHRDLKPENIWIEPNRRGGYTAKVLDFGLVKLGSSARHNRLQPATSRPPASITVEPATAPDDASSATRWATTTPPPDTSNETTAMTGYAAPGALADSAAGLTRIGDLTGTPAYMSPEQCRGELVDARTDIYSLGVIAYRMLAGSTPFSGDAPTMMRMHLTGTPDPVRARNRRVSTRVDRLILSALAKDREQRPATAGGFAAALRAAAEGSGTLLRQAIVLYGDRFPVLFKGALIAHVPVIAIVGLLYIADTTSLISYWAAQLLMFAMVVASLGAYFIVSATLAPLVAQSMVSPLQTLTLRTGWQVLRRRWWVFTAASAVVMALTLFGALLLVVPGVIAAVMHVLYAPVSVMEDGSVVQTLRRARHLAWRTWSTVSVIALIQFALPVLVWILSVDATADIRFDDNWRPELLAFGIQMSGVSGLYQLLNVFVTPLTATMTALLYLKTRQAGGESLNAAVARVTRNGVRRRAWESREQSHPRQAAPATPQPRV